jgi:diguanylate cyclase (GGDEF)-like protein
MRAATELASVRLRDETVGSTASFGVACFTGTEAADLDELLSQAGTALYEAKQTGRNRVIKA